MKETMGIEFVCTGNGGRSPMAETIAKDYVKEIGLEDRVKIYSSGSAVADVMNLNYPMKELIGYVEIALNSGTYQGKAAPVAQEVVDHKEAVAQAAESGDREAKDKIEYCLHYLMADEVAKRNMVLLEQGLVPEGHFHEQTAVRSGVDLILPMKESNAKKVREIYAGSDREPQIETLCSYAGVEGAISDPFGGDMKVWRQTRDKIAEAVVKSIDKAVIEYLQ